MRNPATAYFRVFDILLSVVLTLAALASNSYSIETPDAEILVKTELFFGLSKPDGGTITSEEWTDFLNKSVTPAFREGLTAIDADGRFQDADGKVHSERSKLLILVHPHSADREKSIDTIIATYKKRFNQQCVLRTETPAALPAQPAMQLLPLQEYSAFNASERINDPADFIAFLKRSRFKHGELDHLPDTAIILHLAELEPVVKEAGDEVQRVLETGSAVPNQIVLARRKNGSTYLVNRGLPGAGGISIQAAELGALGIKRIIHIGTCAQLGANFDEKTVIVSSGSYRDGAAVMLAEKDRGGALGLSRPDSDLAGSLNIELKRLAIPTSSGPGYTIPIYYYQPAALIIDLLAGEKYATARPVFMEMEEAAFYESCSRAKVKAASLVVPSDTYALKAGKLTHTFTGDPHAALLAAFKAAVNVLETGK